MDEVTEVVEPEVDPLAEKVEGGEVEATEVVTPLVDPAIDQDKVQARINKIAVEKNSEKSRADRAEKELAELKATKEPVAEPKLEDFDYDEGKFNAAQVQHEVTKQMAAQRNDDAIKGIEVDRQKAASKFFEKQTEFMKDNPNHMDIVNKIPELPADTLSAVYSLDNGPQVAQYLGSHLDIAGEIASTSPNLAAVRLGQISAVLAANTKTVQTSNAPEPVETISGQSTVSKNMDDMSMDEIMAL